MVHDKDSQVLRQACKGKCVSTTHCCRHFLLSVSTFLPVPLCCDHNRYFQITLVKHLFLQMQASLLYSFPKRFQILFENSPTPLVLCLHASLHFQMFLQASFSAPGKQHWHKINCLQVRRENGQPF